MPSIKPKPRTSFTILYLACSSSSLALKYPPKFAAVAQVEKKTFAEQVNEVLEEAANGSMKGILDYSDLPLVSCDYRGTDVSSIVDASLTMVMDGDMVKVIAWYDNEWGYSQRVVDLAELVASKWPS